MAARARDYTLLQIAQYNGWDWVYGPDIDKGHRHQLHHDDLLAKGGVTRSRIPYARGPMLNAAAFGITLEGLLRLMKLYPVDEYVNRMKAELFDAIFGHNPKILNFIIEREKGIYRFGHHYSSDIF
jgi:hypothetical protein